MPLPIRVVLAGIVGGILVFFMGFFEHAVLNWGGRAITSLPADQDAAVRKFLGEQKLPPDIYVFPRINEDNSPAETKRLADEWKAGPGGFLIMAPSGEEVMPPKTLILELISNIVAALIAAWIVLLIAADKTFLWRWKVVVLIAIFGWVSLVASYGIWYHFPWPFIRDDLLCTILEWSVAGAAIAAFLPGKEKKKA